MVWIVSNFSVHWSIRLANDSIFNLRTLTWQWSWISWWSDCFWALWRDPGSIPVFGAFNLLSNALKRQKWRKRGGICPNNKEKYKRFQFHISPVKLTLWLIINLLHFLIDPKDHNYVWLTYFVPTYSYLAPTINIKQICCNGPWLCYLVACKVNGSVASPKDSLWPSTVHIETPHFSGPYNASWGMYFAEVPSSLDLHCKIIWLDMIRICWIHF